MTDPSYPVDDVLSSFSWNEGEEKDDSFKTQPFKESIAAREEIYSDISTIDEEDTTNTSDLDEILGKMLDLKASDLHLTAKMPPMIRVNGELKPLEGYPRLTSNNILNLVTPMLTDRQSSDFQKTHELDVAYSLPGRSRFRVNLLMQQRNVGAVIRGIPNIIKSAEELGLPTEFNDLAMLPRGLVLVTGPTGSGKSTTLAAIVDKANRIRHDHIITVEDPIEFVHENKNCIVSQREIGVDTESFTAALRAALREDPDIILIGEMRDLETIQAAITAAETGHLVFGTLHTQSAAETISRIIDVFPEGSKAQVRQQLGSTVQGIICQTLIKTRTGGRAAAIEYMKGLPSIKNLIRKGQIDQIQSYIETGATKGMKTLDQSLKQLVLDNKVKIDDAADKAVNAEAFYKSFGNEDEINKIRRKEDADDDLAKGPAYR